MASSEPLHRAAGAIAFAAGAGAALVPRLLLRAFGVVEPLSGTGDWGWRMFGVRTALIGGAIVRGDPSARRALVPVQLADQLTFALAARRADVPPRAVLLARAVSGVLIALGLLAGRRDRRR